MHPTPTSQMLRLRLSQIDATVMNDGDRRLKTRCRSSTLSLALANQDPLNCLVKLHRILYDQ